MKIWDSVYIYLNGISTDSPMTADRSAFHSFSKVIFQDVRSVQAKRHRFRAVHAIDENDAVTNVEIETVDDNQFSVEQNLEIVRDTVTQELLQRLGLYQDRFLRCVVAISRLQNRRFDVFVASVLWHRHSVVA